MYWLAGGGGVVRVEVRKMLEKVIEFLVHGNEMWGTVQLAWYVNTE
jgi:hypothetical protein